MKENRQYPLVLGSCRLVILVGWLSLMVSGCFTTQYNLATQQQETLMHDTDKEIQIGAAYDIKVRKKMEINTDVDINERVQRLLDEIVSVCDRKELVYFIKVIDEDKINAVSLPGGYIYLYKGLIDAADNDAQLAGVIAHEVAHITARHGIKRLQAAYGASLLQLATAVAAPEVAGGTSLALNTVFMEYSQKDEFEADKLAVKYMREAGYDPKAMVNFLLKLKKKQEEAPLKRLSYWKTHPNPDKRMAVVRKEITGKLEFRDYLILTEE